MLDGIHQPDSTWVTVVLAGMKESARIVANRTKALQAFQWRIENDGLFTSVET
jgi:hypothetical protein